MQDYLETTSNVIEAAVLSPSGARMSPSSSGSAPASRSGSADDLAASKRDHYLDSPARRACKLLVVVVSFAVATLDVATDWYSYSAALSKSLAAGNDFRTRAFLASLLVICVVATLLWLATLATLILQVYAVGRLGQRLASFELLEEMTSLASLALHDTPMVALLFSALALRFCPLVDHIRTMPGQVALVSTGVSLVWRMVHSLAFCCSFRRMSTKWRQGTRVVAVVTVSVRVLRTLLLVGGALLFLLLISVSFAPQPNALGWLRPVLAVVDMGHAHDGPIYLYQRYDAPYIVRRQRDPEVSSSDSGTGNARHVLSPAEERVQWEDLKRRGVPEVDVNCDHYVRRILVGSASELRRAGERGLARRLDCAEADPLFGNSLPVALRELWWTHHCELYFRVTYDDQRRRISTTASFILTANNSSSAAVTTSSSSSTPTSSSPPVTCVRGTPSATPTHAPVYITWSSEVMTSLKDYECAHSLECPTKVAPLPDVHRQPYFSCLADICEVGSRPLGGRNSSLPGWSHTVSVWPYRLELPASRAYFPCLTTVDPPGPPDADPPLSGTPPADPAGALPVTLWGESCDAFRATLDSDEVSQTEAQILSCPESPYRTLGMVTL